MIRKSYNWDGDSRYMLNYVTALVTLHPNHFAGSVDKQGRKQYSLFYKDEVRIISGRQCYIYGLTREEILNNIEDSIIESIEFIEHNGR